MNILVCSHSDLDGVTAQIVIRQFKGEITRMNISYDKIDEYLIIIEDYCARLNPSEVYVTDLSFTIEQLTKLAEITKKYKDTKFYFIDHHPFKEDYSHLKSDNFMILISPKASATKLVYLYLKNNTKGVKKPEPKAGLEEYVEYVNTYDLWLKDNPRFKGSLVYNELFWDFKKDYYFTRFKDEFKLRNSDKDRYRELMTKKAKLFNKLDKAGRIYTHKKRIFMIFLDDFKNHVTVDYEGYDVYVILSSYGTVSIRLRENLSDDGILKDRIVKRVLENEQIKTAGGHPKAFGIKIENPTARNQVKFAKDLLQIIDEELDTL